MDKSYLVLSICAFLVPIKICLVVIFPSLFLVSSNITDSSLKFPAVFNNLKDACHFTFQYFSELMFSMILKIRFIEI